MIDKTETHVKLLRAQSEAHDDLLVMLGRALLEPNLDRTALRVQLQALTPAKGPSGAKQHLSELVARILR